MESLHFGLLLLCLLGSSGLILACTQHQVDIGGVCCNMCPPGFYVKEYCSEKHETICEPCAAGFFSDAFHLFDRCEMCRSCDQEYSQKCTATTDAECSCGTGFLCSDNTCSKCEKDKCVSGERLKTTAVLHIATNRTKYKYDCEPLCQNHEYYNEKEKVCMLRMSCSAHGLVELFPGNKTHNVTCQSSEVQNLYIVVIAGFVLFIVTMTVIISYRMTKKIKKIKKITDSQPVKLTTIEFCALSMEETIGPIEDEHKEDSFG